MKLLNNGRVSTCSLQQVMEAVTASHTNEDAVKEKALSKYKMKGEKHCPAFNDITKKNNQI